MFRGLGWPAVGIVVGCGGSTSNDTSGSGSEASTSTLPTSSGAATGTLGGGGPVPDEREAELLAPLWVDEATLLAASGPELVELVQSIGLARGYALCRCTAPPAVPPEDIEALMRCAEFETGTSIVAGEARARCINEVTSELPEIE